jgi:hypothetical protein
LTLDLHLTRDVLDPRWTLGVMHVDGRLFGYTVEDFDRLHRGEAKIAKLTAIPAGRYRVRATWSPKYQRLVPEVCDVPGFRGVRIHAGNDAEDTEGCILPGLSRSIKEGKVFHSADACRWLETRIAAADTWITIGYSVPAGFEAVPG